MISAVIVLAVCDICENDVWVMTKLSSVQCDGMNEQY